MIESPPQKDARDDMYTWGSTPLPWPRACRCRLPLLTAVHHDGDTHQSVISDGGPTVCNYWRPLRPPLPPQRLLSSEHPALVLPGVPPQLQPPLRGKLLVIKLVPEPCHSNSNSIPPLTAIPIAAMTSTTAVCTTQHDSFLILLRRAMNQCLCQTCPGRHRGDPSIAHCASDATVTAEWRWILARQG